MKLRTLSEYMTDVKKFLDPSWHDKEEKKLFVFNIILGVTIILIFCVALKDTRPKQESINWYFDLYTLWRMDAEENDFIDKYLLFQKAADMETKSIAKNIIFLYFDDDAIKTLKRPNVTPRDKVADLIRAAYQNEASIIVVDFDFAESDYSSAKLLAGDKRPLSGQERDKILYDLLKTIRDDSNSKTKVLLMRSTYADLTEKKNIFADLIDGKKIFEVTPNYSEFGGTRFWLPYSKAKNEDTKQTRILWSVPIMTLVLTQGNLNELHKLEKQILNDNNQNIDVYPLKINQKGVTKEFQIYEERYEKGGVVRDTATNQYNRIQYVLFPSHTKSSKLITGNIATNQLCSWDRYGIDTQNFTFKDKIAIVGRGDEDCEDFHATPVARMPGMYIHANSIATVLSSSRPHLCSTIMHVMIELFLVIMAAYVFLNFSGQKVGYTILLMFAACWILPFFYYCFTNEYIFLNMAFMSLGFYNGSKVLENISWRGVSGLPKIISILEKK